MVISSIISHPRVSNLNLGTCIKIGASSGVIASLVFVFAYQTSSWPLIRSQAISLIALALAGLFEVFWLFFRDPERVSNADPSVILSPADGKIIYIREFKNGALPCPVKGRKNINIVEISKTDFLNQGDGYIFGINMSLLDVHVNRVPMGGVVVFLKHTPGGLVSLKNWASETENVRNTTIIRKGDCSIAVIQIGSKFVSKIRCYIKENATLTRGGRLGKITFGSQVDLIIPKKYLGEVLAYEGQQVYAGLTPLAAMNY